MSFSHRDIRQMKKMGVSPEEVTRQIKLFRHPPKTVALDRACRIGDGVRLFSPIDASRFSALAEEASRAGRLTKFVPASGGSTRMLKSIMAIRNVHGSDIHHKLLRAHAARGHVDFQEALVLMEGFKRLPFYPELRRRMRRKGLDTDRLIRQGRFGLILHYLLSSDGLNYEAFPKLLMHFHAVSQKARHVFEDHLLEAAALVKDAHGICRIHFSVPPTHRRHIELVIESVLPRYERLCRCRFRVSYSTQKPSTDTIAVDMHNQPFRLPDGGLLFRPGGHGALIENIQDLGADILLISNVDNIAPDHTRNQVIAWRKVLIGHLVELEAGVSYHLKQLTGGPSDKAVVLETLRFLRENFGIQPPARYASHPSTGLRRWLGERLNRPLRVAGVVKNEGEPGGGPFWVKEPSGGVSLQMVESAQVSSSPSQQAILKSSTHFNPVDIICSLRDSTGKLFDLKKFVDSSAVFISHRFHKGHDIKALELPGLWNGGMAGWNTAFVEMPSSTFNPVKTINDLLSPNHQPA